MVRRIISIGFTALMILSVLVVIDVIPIANVRGEQNPPDDLGTGLDVQAGDGIWTTDGDWIIQLGNTVSHSDKTILVNGNLIIQEAASLTLSGVRLEINSSYNGEFHIEVQAASGFPTGGTFTVQNSGATPSIITSATEDGDHRFAFWVRGHAQNSKEAHLYMTNSELHECGWDNELLNNSEDSGLWIGSSDNTIDGNDISNVFNGVNYVGLTASTNTFQNNNVSYTDGNGTYVRTATDITIDNNDYFECVQGIDVNSSANIVVTNNYFNVIYQYGVYFGSVAGVTFSYNTVENLQGFLSWVFAAVVISDFSSNILAEYNHLHNNPFSGIVAFYYSGGATFRYNIFDDLYRSVGIGAQWGDTAYFYRNVVGENTSFIGYDSVGIWASQITGLTQVIENEAYNTDQWIYSNWGAGIQLWSVDEGIVRGNRMADNFRSGMYILDSGNVSLTIEDNVMDDNGAYGIYMTEPNTAPQFGGVKNTIVDNNYINGSAFGIASNKGFNQKYTNNSLNLNTDTGIWTGVDGTYIAFNTITNTGTGANAGEGGMGIVGNSYDDPTVENVVIDQNTIDDNIAVSIEPINGIYLSEADNIWINECTFDNNDVTINGLGSVTNVLVENSTITSGVLSDNDFALVDNSHITTLNTTFDNSSLSVDATSNLTAKWYLHVNVKQGGIGRNGATVQVEDIFGNLDPQSGNPFTTTEDENLNPGWVKWIQTTEFVNEGGTRIDHTSHWVNASYSSAEALATPNMWESQTKYLDLNEVPSVVNFNGVPSSVYRADTLYLFINGTDVEDWESEFQNVTFEYRDPNDFAWNTTYFGPVLYYDTDGNPNNDNGQWYVAFTPPIGAITGFYDIRGRVQDTYGSWSPWTTYLDAAGIDVRNNPPDVEIMYNTPFNGSAGAGVLYRGGNTWIYGDGNDVEDGDDQNFITAEFQYKRPGESWGAHSVYWSPNTPQKGGGDWYQNFFPSASIDTPVGLYEFQVRFQDLDGLWGNWENLDSIDIINNPPQYDGFSSQSSEVYRGNTVRVYVDAWDYEEQEQDLTVEFFYQHSTLGTGWEQTWLSLNGNWDSFTSSFYADFTPPNTAGAGFYDFRVDITDHERPMIDGDTDSRDLGPQIDVKNNNPDVLNVMVSQDIARAGIDTVFIHVNASDDFNSESELKIQEMWWRENNSASQQPPARPWEKDGSKIVINTDQGYVSSGGGYLRGSMKPENNDNVYKGWYDIKLTVRDLESGISSERFLYHAFQVTNPAPLLLDYVVSSTEVFRGDTVYIFVNASDPSLDEDDLTVEIQYRKDGTSQTWNNLDSEASTDYDGSPDSGHWAVPFSPSLTWDDGDLDVDYEFRVRIWNGAIYSNDNSWNYTDNIKVLNNLPEAQTIDAGSEDTVERGSTIIIYANGYDRETDEDDLDAYFQYSIDGSNWDDLTGEDFNNGQWEVEFTPDNEAVLGNYHFRVRFHDGEDFSDYEQAQNLVEVTNAKPVVTSLLISSASGLRGEEFILTAIVSDADSIDEGELTPDFQFKGESGSFQSSTTYFKNENYIGNGQWQVIFVAPAGADTGDYSFKVIFTDNAGASSDEFTITDALSLENADPTVEIDTPLSGTQDGAKVTFDGTADDDDGTTVTWYWEFGDGKDSYDESPTHEYSEPGDYTVKVTVTDEDDGTATDSVSIVIKDAGGGFDLMTLLLILIPIIVGVILLLFLLTRKKKKPEEIPPAVPGAQAPGVAAAPPPMAAPPPAAMPGAPPAAAPPPPAAVAAAPAAAVPAAAPAAVPGGGQRIKCPKCGTPFNVTDPTRPITIECPNCHAKGTIK